MKNRHQGADSYDVRTVVASFLPINNITFYCRRFEWLGKYSFKAELATAT
jgi:hypothetical protein